MWLSLNGRGSSIVLVALLSAGLALRLLVLGVPGHGGDIRIMAGWAERMAEVGPWPFYEASRSIYPALLYPLGLLGVLLDGEQLAVAIKGLSIPFDLAIGALLFAISHTRLGRRAALVVAALFLFNPSALLAGPIWGQVESAGTLPYLAALVAAGAGRTRWAGALGVVAGLVKPQFGLVLLPVLAVATIRARQERRLRPLLGLLAGGVAAYVVVGLPLALHPGRYITLLLDAASRQATTSLHAFNQWGLLVGFDVPDDPYVGLATALFVFGAGSALLRLRRGQALGDVLATGTLLALAFYFLPTRVHERYLFPVIATAAPLALAGRALLAAYLLTSVAFAASLIYALERTTSFTLPAPMADAVTSPAGVWTIGLVLIGSSAVVAWKLAVGPASAFLSRPPAPRRRGGHGA